MVKEQSTDQPVLPARIVIAEAIRDLTVTDPEFNYYAGADTILDRLRDAGYRIAREAVAS